jgi:DNA transposition AAA+ family ATPase
MPTRVPAYMASGTPILVYGPPDIAQVQYAEKVGWAHVVNKREIKKLKDAIISLISASDFRASLSISACTAARTSHNMKINREKFRTALSMIIVD